MNALRKEEREIVEAKMECLQAKVDQQREEAEAQRQYQAKEAEAQRQHQAKEAESHRQLASLPALQSRLERLHASKFLMDEELFRLEDVIADSLEEEAGGSGGGRDRVAKLMVLSDRLASDAALARQLRRKFA